MLLLWDVVTKCCFIIQVAEGAKAAGASRIIGIDTDPKKASIGKLDYVFSCNFNVKCEEPLVLIINLLEPILCEFVLLQVRNLE